jgi:hypothetical protein
MSHTFYGHICAEGYDLGAEQQTLIDFYFDPWRRAGKPFPVLEPMCSAGINLIAFLESGVEANGPNSSLSMVADCRQKCAAKGLRPQFYMSKLEQL